MDRQVYRKLYIFVCQDNSLCNDGFRGMCGYARKSLSPLTAMRGHQATSSNASQIAPLIAQRHALAALVGAALEPVLGAADAVEAAG